MAYNYAREKQRFDDEWKRKELWYRKEGMSEGDIEAMRRFDLAQFNRDRAYESRRRPLEMACGSFYIQIQENGTGRYSWIDEISNPQLVVRLCKLSESDIALLKLLVIDGHSQAEVASILGIAQQTVSVRFNKIKKLLS